jgi:[ribosomal protein S18]-alanine N-acetyltransferase
VSVVVRPAVERDVAAITELEAVAFPADPWSRNLVGEGVAGRSPTVTFYVAERAGEVVGHAVISVVGDDAELQRLAAAPEARRAGVATALLDGVRAAAAAQGVARLLLEVREDNTAALAFYDRAGFTQIARRERYYRDGTTALILEKHL